MQKHGRFGSAAQSMTDSSEHGGWDEDDLEEDGESDAIEPGECHHSLLSGSIFMLQGL